MNGHQCATFSSDSAPKTHLQAVVQDCSLLQCRLIGLQVSAAAKDGARARYGKGWVSGHPQVSRQKIGQAVGLIQEKQTLQAPHQGSGCAGQLQAGADGGAGLPHCLQERCMCVNSDLMQVQLVGAGELQAGSKAAQASPAADAQGADGDVTLSCSVQHRCQHGVAVA